MTANQINYWALQEEKRHNSEQETFQREANRETKRSNLSREAEQARTNLANEQIREAGNAINLQHYERLDAETLRSHQQSESLSLAQLESAYAQQATQRYVAETSAGVGYANVAASYANLTELAQHNRVTEDISYKKEASIANVNARKQALSEKQFAFEQQKYEEYGRTQAQANLMATAAQYAASVAQRGKIEAETKVIVPNTVSNFLGSAARLIRPVKLGGK